MTAAASSHLPPQDIESEEAILGAMMTSPRAREAVVDLGLNRDHFYRPAHRTIFDAITTISDQDHVDERVVINQLKATSGTMDGAKMTALEHAGGPNGVLAIAERTPAAANAKAYAAAVIRTATFRRITEVGYDIARLGHEAEGDPKTVVDKVGQLVSALTVGRTDQEFVTLDSILDAFYEELYERSVAGSNIVGIPTGFTAIDSMLGGLQREKFIVVAARPAMGKTAFAVNIIEHVAMIENGNVAMFSLEMGPTEIASRVVSNLASIEGSRLRNTVPRESDFPLVVDAISKLKRHATDRVHIDPSVDLTPHSIRGKARRLARRLESKGQRLDVVVVDYMQLMSGSDRAENRQTEVAAISRALKLLAMELRCPVIALSQLSRGLESRPDKRPMLSDLRESGGIEQDADQVLFLFRPEVYEPDSPELHGMAEVIVAKNRQGRIGSELLRFQSKYTRFTAWVPNEPARPPVHTPGPGGVY